MSDLSYNEYGYCEIPDEEVNGLVYTEYDDGSGCAELEIGNKKILIAEIDRSVQDMFYRDGTEKDGPENKSVNGYSLKGYTSITEDESYKQIARDSAMKYLEHEKNQRKGQER